MEDPLQEVFNLFDIADEYGLESTKCLNLCSNVICEVPEKIKATSYKRDLSRITSLNLSGLKTPIANLQDLLKKFPNLKILVFSGWGWLRNLDFLEGAKNLRILKVNYCPLRNLEGLKYCEKLTSLQLLGIKGYDDVSFYPIKNCPQLGEVDFRFGWWEPSEKDIKLWCPHILFINGKLSPA